jgi:hypothetical protein
MFALRRGQRVGDARFAVGTKLYAVRDLPLARALLVERHAGYWWFDALKDPDRP